jgi:3-deoxy-7-phosphoheptulonate synthase
MNETVVNAAPNVIAGLENYLTLPAMQQPTWPDAAAVAAVRAELAIQPPLVFAGEDSASDGSCTHLRRINAGY